jgi:hypothetical protein
MIKEKQKEKAVKWEVSLPGQRVYAQGEAEAIKVIQTGKRKKKAWKSNIGCVADSFTRKPPDQGDSAGQYLPANTWCEKEFLIPTIINGECYGDR